MRMQAKNMRPIWYATYLSETARVDSDGNKTGEYDKTYSTPVKLMLNVKTVSSKTDVEMYGVESKNTIKVVSETKLPITDTSILWFGIDPPSPYTASAPNHNYEIDGIPSTLNDFVFYARKVK